MRPRITILAGMGLVLFAALGVAALRFPSLTTARLAFSGTVLTFGVATLGALLLTGRSRAFSVGAAVFGGGYLALAFAGDSDGLLVTTPVLAKLDGLLGGLEPDETVSDAVFLRRTTLDLAGTIPSPQETLAFVADTDVGKRAELIDRLVLSRLTAAPPTRDTASFIRIGHCLVAVLIAVVGGLIARYIELRRGRLAPG